MILPLTLFLFSSSVSAVSAHMLWRAFDFLPLNASMPAIFTHATGVTLRTAVNALGIQQFSIASQVIDFQRGPTYFFSERISLDGSGNSAQDAELMTAFLSMLPGMRQIQEISIDDVIFETGQFRALIRILQRLPRLRILTITRPRNLQVNELEELESLSLMELTFDARSVPNFSVDFPRLIAGIPHLQSISLRNVNLTRAIDFGNLPEGLRLLDAPWYPTEINPSVLNLLEASYLATHFARIPLQDQNLFLELLFGILRQINHIDSWQPGGQGWILTRLIIEFIGVHNPTTAARLLLLPILDNRRLGLRLPYEGWTIPMYIAILMGPRNPQEAASLLNSMIDTPDNPELHLPGPGGETLAMLIAQHIGPSNPTQAAWLLGRLIGDGTNQNLHQRDRRGRTLAMHIAQSIGSHDAPEASLLLAPLIGEGTHPGLHVRDDLGWNLATYIRQSMGDHNRIQANPLLEQLRQGQRRVRPARSAIMPRAAAAAASS